MYLDTTVNSTIAEAAAGSASKYDLIANVVHEGLPDKGFYRAQVHRQGEDTWYDVQDLRVTDVLPQMVALSETYIQLYELRTDKPSAKVAAATTPIGS